MHFRRIACWLLGAWFIGSIAVSRITSSNFAAVDRVLDSPVPEVHLIAISRSRPVARSLLRYMAVDLNRGYFTEWQRLQLLLGAGIVVVLLADSRKRGLIVLALSAMVLVAFQHFWVTPEILFIEQARTFPSQNGPPVSEYGLGRMQLLYNAVEAAKLLLVLALSALLIKMQGKEYRSKKRRTTEPGIPDPMQAAGAELLNESAARD